ncbi:MAG: hydrogenase expression/formation protein HypE [Spirochaetales bacterium]|nr:hydrogenase expression/formation protein HypE [Spirochaetales bacterium]
MSKDIITLAHGNGGLLTHTLIEQVFAAAFANPILDLQGDSALIGLESGAAVFTTDSFVIKPLFFPGGDIGKLAVAGTVNDLAVAGAVPRYLSASFIIEEGLPINELKTIVASMQRTARQAGVVIVAGDTKVVEKGGADKLFITTSGIGTRIHETQEFTPANMRAGDCVLLSGTIGDHAIAVLSARGEYPLKINIQSDCACLNDLTCKLLRAVPAESIRIMRDPTRGGLATTLNEFAKGGRYAIEIEESEIPCKQEVQAVCELTGFDPLYLANEGKLVLVCASEHSSTLLEIMRAHPLAKAAACIGRITDNSFKKVVLKTTVGGTRIVDMLAGEMLPRIC